MAKKKQELSPEERLAAALVPEEEQPYQLPEGWKWVRLLDGAAICMDNKRKPINSRERATRYGDVPYYGATGQVGWIDDYLTDEELILLGEDGAPFLDLYKSKAYIISGKAWVNNHAHILRSFMGHIGNVYLMYYLNTFDYRKYVSGTTRLKLTQGKMRSIPVPYPSCSEQERIVARIESLFAKLDAAKAKVQSVLDAHEARKAALLHDAFTGKLTAKWRDEHGQSLANWQEKTLGDCGKWIGGGTPSKAHPEYWENGNIMWITSKDMKNDVIQDTQMHITPLGVEESSAIYSEQNAILFVMRSGILRHTLPVAVVYKPFTINQDLKALIPNDGIDAYYLFLAAKAFSGQMLKTCMKNGTTVESINTKKLLAFSLPIASMEEQKVISEKLQQLLAKQQKVMETAEQVLISIDRMKQSILARAFRGEL